MDAFGRSHPCKSWFHWSCWFWWTLLVSVKLQERCTKNVCRNLEEWVWEPRRIATLWITDCTSPETSLKHGLLQLPLLLNLYAYPLLPQHRRVKKLGAIVRKQQRNSSGLIPFEEEWDNPSLWPNNFCAHLGFSKEGFCSPIHLILEVGMACPCSVYWHVRLFWKNLLLYRSQQGMRIECGTSYEDLLDCISFCFRR